MDDTNEGVTYQFVTLTPHVFFSDQAIELLGPTVQMAHQEKTIADGFDHPAPVGGVWDPALGLWLGILELDMQKQTTCQLGLSNRGAARRLADKASLGAGEAENRYAMLCVLGTL